MPGEDEYRINIPLREEARLDRLTFFHHDVRAFTTSVGEKVARAQIAHVRSAFVEQCFDNVNLAWSFPSSMRGSTFAR